MRILADENVPRITVDYLRKLGHDVKDIRGTPDRGLEDADLWEIAVAESRLLVTTDKGFTQYRDVRHSGILIIRLRQPNRSRIHNRVMYAMAKFAPDQWPGLLVVMRDTTQSVSRCAD